MGALFWCKEFGGSRFLYYLCVSIVNYKLKTNDDESRGHSFMVHY